MIALLRKDARWLAAFAVVGMVVHLGHLFIQGAAEVWIVPTEEYLRGCLVLHWFGATALGLFATLHEEVRHTREYLSHRPVSRAGIFLARQLGCSLVMALWILVPPALHLVGAHLVRGDAAVLDRGRFAHFLTQNLGVFALYGAAAFAGTLAGRRALALLLGVSASLAVVLLLGRPLVGRVPPTLPPWAHVALALALGLLFLFAAYLHEQERDERDIPWSSARLRRGGVPAIILTLLPVSLSVTWGQHVAREAILREYPLVRRAPDGSLALYVSSGTFNHELEERIRVDHRHRPTGEVAQGRFDRRSVLARPFLRNADSRYDQSEGTIGTRLVFKNVESRFVGCGVRRTCLLPSAGGLLQILQHGGKTGNQPGAFRRTVGKPPPGGAFSSRARILAADDDRWLLVADPEDERLWAYDLDERAPNFLPVELPDGDRFVTWGPGVSAISGDSFSPRRTGIVRGKTGAYAWERGRLRPLAEDEKKVLARWDSWVAERSRATFQGEDPIVFAVEIRDAEGRLILRHDYAPYTGAEKALAATMAMLSPLRPPTLAMASCLSRPDASHWGIWRDDLLAGGKRPGLLAAILGLALGLAALALRRGRRLGMPAGRAALWAALVLALGPVGYLCFRLVETGRAWRRVPAAEGEPLSAPLIASA